ILRKAFADRSNLVIAEAAKTVGELQLSGLTAELLAAFDRLFHEPVKTDPKCWVKLRLSRCWRSSTTASHRRSCAVCDTSRWSRCTAVKKTRPCSSERILSLRSCNAAT